MKKLNIFLFGSLSYTIFFGVFLYWIGFTINFIVPKGIDDGEQITTLSAIIINTLLVLLFGLHHSISARQGFKDLVYKFIPKAAERSFYVLISSVIVGFMFWQWKPILTSIWFVENGIATNLLYGLYAIGWVIMLISTFLINHFELFGLQQIYNNFRNKEMKNASFKTPFLYKLVRHPMMVGIFITFWATPNMTLGHLLFSILMSVYILIGVYYEERDLLKVFGNKYRKYQSRVPVLIPFIKPNKSSNKELSLT